MAFAKKLGQVKRRLKKLAGAHALVAAQRRLTKYEKQTRQILKNLARANRKNLKALTNILDDLKRLRRLGR